jgi:CubicO group peptidase (beta-lactamase class C family)
VLALAVLTALLAACGTGERHDAASPPSTAPASSRPLAPSTAPSTAPSRSVRAVAPESFADTDAALDRRVADAGLTGAFLRVVADDGTVLHEHGVGGFDASTPLDVASSTKWLTAATFMTFVDDGAIGLDDDVARWLPEFGGSDPPVTARELLDHTSGVHDNACQSDGTALAACVRTLAGAPREFPAGTQFSYGNSPFLVVGRLVEVLGGDDFAAVVARRLTTPLGMESTTWSGAPAAPSPAFGATTTVADYGRFLAMLLAGGTLDGRRVLSRAAVDQLVTNQVGRYDTSHDPSVGITGIPRYGLGCWPDVVGADGATTVVSGNGGKGFYPWIDLTTRTWGVVGVQDERGAAVAVPASQAVAVAARSAVAR